MSCVRVTSAGVSLHNSRQTLSGWPADACSWLRAGVLVSAFAGAMSAASPTLAQPRIDPNDLAGTAVLTFSDDFHSLSLWNGQSGTWETTFPWTVGKNGSTLPGNREEEWYIDANFMPTRASRPWSVADGKLFITASRADAATQALIGGYHYISGLLTTLRSFRQTYGYFEMRAKMPSGRGLWPAFWLLPPDGVWPPELDVAEVLAHDPSTIYTTVHTSVDGKDSYQQKATQVEDTSQGWHTYAVDWEADKIIWYFDGKRIYETATPRDMHGPMYMVLDLAVGGHWPGAPDANTKFPASLEVEYVRAYRPK